jgi:hypothetical protein
VRRHIHPPVKFAQARLLHVATRVSLCTFGLGGLNLGQRGPCEREFASVAAVKSQVAAGWTGQKGLRIPEEESSSIVKRRFRMPRPALQVRAGVVHICTSSRREGRPQEAVERAPQFGFFERRQMENKA